MKLHFNKGLKLCRLAAWAAAILILFSFGFGQKALKLKQNEYLEVRRSSRLMAREMPYRIILPAAYRKDKKQRFPVMYLIHGRTGNYRDWSNLTKIRQYSTQYDFIIVMSDGGTDGWYSDSVITPNDKYESYFVQELIPEIDANYRTLTDRSHRVIGGLSMGGYGAIKFGLKYPEKFLLAGSFSGAFDAVIKTQKYPHLVKSVEGVFGDENNPSRSANDVFRMIREASPEQIKSLPFLFIDCGTEDHQFEANRDFVALLTDKKVPHEYRQMPGAHNWTFWDSEIQEFLRVANRFVSGNKQSLGKS